MPRKPRFNISLIVFCGSLGLMLLFAWLGWQSREERLHLWQLQLAKQSESQELALQNLQRAQRQNLELLASMVAADSWTVELVRQAQALHAEGAGLEDEPLELIRAQLYTRLAPRWRALQDEQNFDLHLHLAPAGETLLSLQQITGFSSSRELRQPILDQALDSGKPQSGLGAGYHGIGMRAVALLRVDDFKGERIVGAVIVDSDPLHNLQQLDSQLESGVALLLNEQLLDPVLGLEEAPGLPTAPQWRLRYHSRAQIGDWLAQGLLPTPESRQRQLIEESGSTYLLTQIPLQDSLGREDQQRTPLAVVLLWRDISELADTHRQDLRQLVFKWLLAWLCASLLLFGLLLVSRRTLLRQHRDHQHDLHGRHRESEASRRLLAIVSQAQAAYIDTKNHRQTFDQLLRQILDLTDSGFGFFGEILQDSYGQRVLNTYAIGSLGASPTTERYNRHAPEVLPLDDSASLLGRLAHSGLPLIDNAPPEAGHGLPDGPERLTAFLGLPIVYRGQLLGLLGLTNRPGGYADNLPDYLAPLQATLGQLLDALRQERQRTAAEQRQKRQQQALGALNEIAALPHLSSQEQLRRALELGAAFYGLPLGVISRIDGDDYQVLVQVSPAGSLEDGQHFALQDTYCQLNLEGTEPLAISYMSESRYADHPCYRAFALEAYIGTNLWVGGKRFGTLNFSSAKPHSPPFDEADLEFIRLFGRWVGATLERQQQEQARQTLLERLDKAQRIARLGHWEANLVTGELYWSSVIFDIFGHDPEHFRPSIEAFKRSVHPDDLVLIEQSEMRARAGGVHDVVHRIVRPDGEIRWVHELARLQPDEFGRMERMVGTVQDISDRARAEAALEEQRQRLASIIEGTHIGTWEWNVQSGKIVLNERWAEIVGYRLEELQPLTIDTWKRLAHPEDLPLSQESLERHSAGETPFYDCQYRMRHKDGHWVWVHDRGQVVSHTADGKPLMMYGTHTDISEAKEREEQIREARAFLLAVLDSATGVSIIATDPDGLIILFNSGAERLLGYPAEEMVSRATPTTLHLESEVQARGEQLSSELGRPVQGFEVFVAKVREGEPETRQWTYVCKSGDLRTVNLTVSAIRDNAGTTLGFLGIASDITELQQATRALQKSESRFRGMVASLPGVVYRCSNDIEWTMRYVSEAIYDLTGYPPSDFIDNQVRSFASVIHPDDLPTTYGAQRSLELKEPFELTYRLLHADGRDVWVREKGRGEYDSQGNLLWVNGFIWDISERKHMEDALRLSQQRFYSAFNTAPQGMALVSPEGRWLEVNDELCRMLGYSREELLERDVEQLTHPDDREEDRRNVSDLLAGRIHGYQLEKRYLDKTKRVIWTLLSVSLLRDDGGQPLYFVSQIQDFSERVAAERDIREREHYLRAVLDNVLDAIVTIDAQGRIETFNHAAEKLFGYSQSEVAGHDVKILLADAPHDGHLERNRLTGDSQLIGSTREVPAVRRNGDVFTMELAVSQISHQGEQRFIAVIRDISERKRIERMKNEFVSTVSHELRTPLTSIAGSLGLINGGVLGEVPDGMRQMLQIAQQNSQRLNLLINDLLDMDKLVAGEMSFDMQPQPLMPLLEQALEQNQPYARQHRVRLLLCERLDEARVEVDSQRLEQVMANLLSNAAKFSPPGADVEIRAVASGQQVRVSVRDYGCGVPDAFQARIFSKFSQADASDTRQKGGTGLGLAICKELIQRMGGHIGFDSPPGQGATFWFELPLIADQENGSPP